MLIPLHPVECVTHSGTVAKIISIDNTHAVCLLGEYMSIDGTVHAESWDLDGNPASGLPERQIDLSTRNIQRFITDVFYKLAPIAKQAYGQQWEENLQSQQYFHFWEKLSK